MKSFLPILSIVLVLGSCSTAYKSGQTPDDVYYSPTRPEYDDQKNEDRNEDRAQRDEREDRYERMKVKNRRWTILDDEDYTYRPVYTSTYPSSPWNAYSHWNYYYNPYCCCNSNPVIIKGTPASYSKPRTFNLGMYTPTAVNGNVKGQTATRTAAPVSEDNNYRGSGQSAGGFLRGLFGGGSSSSGSSSSSSSTPAAKGSSSSSSGSSSSGSSSGRRF